MRYVSGAISSTAILNTFHNCVGARPGDVKKIRLSFLTRTGRTKRITSPRLIRRGRFLRVRVRTGGYTRESAPSVPKEKLYE